MGHCFPEDLFSSPQQIPLLFVHVPHASFPLILASPNRLDPMPQSPQLACGPRPARTSLFFLDILWHVDRNVRKRLHILLACGFTP
jgi:hypothetical protein